jgi:hypothetical protein
VTLVGNQAVAATNQNGAHFRRGTDFQLFNSIVCYWKQQAIRVEHDATCTGLNPETATYVCGARVDAPVVAGAADGLGLRAFPNPVSSATNFAFSLPAEGRARLDVFDVAGRRVASVLDEESLDAGRHEVAWSPGASVSAGTYFYRLETDGKPVQGRLVVVR